MDIDRATPRETQPDPFETAWRPILDFYDVEEPNRAREFLRWHPDVAAMLIEAFEHLPDLFPEGFETHLLLDFDEETRRTYMTLVIATGLPFQERWDRENELDARWGIDRRWDTLKQFHVVTP